MLVREPTEPTSQPHRGSSAEEVPVNDVGLRCYGKHVGTKTLHGCDDAQGREVVPFIHRTEFGKFPAMFFRSGFALVQEEPDLGEKCPYGWYYIDSTYSRKLAALGLEGVPDIWLPESERSQELLRIGRYRENGRVGFLDIDRGIITEAKFGAALSFHGGDEALNETLVCEGCHPARWSICPPPEAYCTGTAYLIDRSGKRLKKEPGRGYEEYWWCKKHPGRKDVPIEIKNTSACD